MQYITVSPFIARTTIKLIINAASKTKYLVQKRIIFYLSSQRRSLYTYIDIPTSMFAAHLGVSVLERRAEFRLEIRRSSRQRARYMLVGRYQILPKQWLSINRTGRVKSNEIVWNGSVSHSRWHHVKYKSETDREPFRSSTEWVDSFTHVENWRRREYERNYRTTKAFPVM